VLPLLQAGQDVTSIGINGSAMLSDDGAGIWVYSVASGSPADLTGIRGGDIVTEVEGLIPATDGTMADYCDVLRSHDLDAALQVEVWRAAVGSYMEGTLNTDKVLAPVVDATAAGSGSGTGNGESDSGAGTGQAVGTPLAVGECINDDQVDAYLQGSAYSVTSCDEPHHNEVFYRYEFPEGPFPGEEAVHAEMANTCLLAFEPYVGRDYESSALDVFPTWPTEGLWASGDRSGECLLYEVDQSPLVGSAYQSGW